MEQLSNFFDSVWIDVIKSAIATASILAMATPNQFDNRVLAFVRGLVDLAALNFGNAKNEKK